MELRAGMPLARPEQVRDLGVRPALDELADRVAAVEEPAVLAVDKADRALGAMTPSRPGRDRAGVVGRVGAGAATGVASSVMAEW